MPVRSAAIAALEPAAIVTGVIGAVLKRPATTLVAVATAAIAAVAEAAALVQLMPAALGVAMEGANSGPPADALLGRNIESRKNLASVMEATKSSIAR